MTTRRCPGPDMTDHDRREVELFAEFLRATHGADEQTKRDTYRLIYGRWHDVAGGMTTDAHGVTTIVLERTARGGRIGFALRVDQWQKQPRVVVDLTLSRMTARLEQ